MNEHVRELLPRVRKIILQERVRIIASHDGPTNPIGFGLSWLTWQLGPTRNSHDWRMTRKRFTSGGLKTIRGHAQACLAILAREGIVFGRNRPEGAVQSYGHGETDKRFRIRISPEEAKRRLSKMT